MDFGRNYGFVPAPLYMSRLYTDSRALSAAYISIPSCLQPRRIMPLKQNGRNTSAILRSAHMFSPCKNTFGVITPPVTIRPRNGSNGFCASSYKKVKRFTKQPLYTDELGERASLYNALCISNALCPCPSRIYLGLYTYVYTCTCLREYTRTYM